jgi:hypothetical protein
MVMMLAAQEREREEEINFQEMKVKVYPLCNQLCNLITKKMVISIFYWHAPAPRPARGSDYSFAEWSRPGKLACSFHSKLLCLEYFICYVFSFYFLSCFNFNSSK